MKRAELLPVSGSGLCDLSRTRLADYVTLLAIDNPEECRFYEVEAEAAKVQYL